jgi:hypothetical protein
MVGDERFQVIAAPELAGDELLVGFKKLRSHQLSVLKFKIPVFIGPY